jgi:hypothetical protein
VYTLSGKWHYLEYPDQPQVAGSYLYEPSGQFHSILDAVLIHQLAAVLSEQQGLGPINYIGGGEAAYTAQPSGRRATAIDQS